ncbi:MAG TPA: undecaprenyl-phosphate glucose phosphotransferase [Chromatiales bacterium]|nr:undecaprenyl-phosphate glucose phosphotransferase [Thiotrichales bacterium]HIP68103.1 undecaprenyl-phosphate glucose phosphotransferase [Chromatiales bacterium]
MPHTKSIQTHQPPLELAVRIADSLCIGLALFVSTQLLDIEWSRIHAFYALAAILFMQFIAEFLHLYQNWKISQTKILIIHAITTWVVTCSLLFFFAVLFDQSIEDLYLGLALRWFFLTLLFLAMARYLINVTVRLLRYFGKNTKRVVIAGGGPLATYVLQQLHNNPWVGYKIVGIYDDRSNLHYRLSEVVNKRKFESIDGIHQTVKLDGKFEDMYQAAHNNEFDAVFMAMPMRAESKVQEIIRKLSATTAAVYVVPDFYSIETHYTQLVNINGMPAVSIYENPVSGLRGIVKRLEDIVFSIIILSIIAIPMLLIAVAIKLTSKGPVLFKQQRYGLDGKPIKVWKFRSMKVMENDNKVIQAKKDDPRITRLGAFLRKTSLDELPQFFNVLAGDMSIVGPRPHAVAHNEEYRKVINGYMLRHKTKPGITGWAQINGFRGETDTLDKMENRVEYDIDYIRRWSVFFDVKIILLTVFKGFTGNNAY